ncbi:MAG TPA: peptidyl-prolyl cis-trans isomerase [Blastocatellia bacterium]
MQIGRINIALLLGIALLGASVARAQENDVKPIDEVIARVNAGVIMRSAFESQQRELLEELKKQGLQGEELEKKFNEWKPRILDDLINGQLLAQRAKDLSINVDAQVNQQILRLMKDSNCDSDKCLEQKMREAGYDVEEYKRFLGETFSRQAVLGQEVYSRIYRALTEKEKREYYEKNKQIYTKPGELTLSNIFIAFGKDPDKALERAKEVVTQARAGAMDFKALAEKYTDSEPGKKDPSLGTFKIPDLKPEIKTLVENAKAGDVTDPVKLEAGYSIFRVDERKEPTQLAFDDEAVQNHIGQTLVEQHGKEEEEAYLTKLRNDAFIEIDPRYQFENSKVKSAQIKRVPYTDEKDKKKEKKEKDKDKKAAEAPKATAKNDNKP